MIDRDSKLSISRQAELLKLSRGSVYYLPKPVSARDLDLMRRLDELRLKRPFMGVRMLRDQLHEQGIRAGRKRVKTLIPSGHKCSGWGSRRSTANPTPVRSCWDIKSTLICCAV